MPSWKIVAGVTALMFFGATTLIGVGYAMTPIPDAPQDGVTDEGSAILYGDGKTPIVRLGATRESVPLSKVPEHVRTAVLAAEDRGFYSEHGVSPKGLARAVLKTAVGGDTQGGSTITQQLARNYYKGLSQDRTMSRKFKEIFISLKLGRKLDKNKILEMYLNTVFFGRQANGIQAASRAYFRKDVSQLNVAQAAMLAAMIQRPNYFQTRGDGDANQALRYRWNYVLDGMVEMGKLSQADRQRIQFPKTQYRWTDATATSQTTFIQERVMEELSQVKGVPEDVQNGGLRITTSLDPKWMGYAKDAMKEAGVARWPSKIGAGLIAVDPKNGEIKAFYGGNPERSQVDTVFTPGAQVGSSFKPYVLATALKEGQSVKSTIMGRSPQTFDVQGDNVPRGQGYTVNNDEGDPPMGVINLVTATEKSVNTAYVKLGLKLGIDNVIDTAEGFGVPPKYFKNFHGQQGAVALGVTNIPAVYQASGYAAFANGGRPVTPHLITKVELRKPDGKMETLDLPWDKQKKPILTKDQAAQATYAMKSVVRNGTATRARLSDGREVAGKTGTTEKNAAAWFVGYVPQLSTAVTMYNEKSSQSIKGIPGFQGNSIYGGTIPAQIWKNFMEKVIAGENMQPQAFDAPTYSDSTPKTWDTPPPAPSPTPSETPSCDPGTPGAPGSPTGQPCPSQSPTTSPSPTTPPDAGRQPCDQWGMPVGCNPDIPPSDPPPTWWCARHPDAEQCRDTDQDRPNQPQTQSRTSGSAP
ncbi:transglycosylase domain-containing protein [Spirillospora sp. NPDC047279]|uniref:transglycosylase domain-containing protein n=1 Tax=Spirillospora sp. NPDC047279 TaxID=3155478 RepID=UPI00340E91A7